MASKIDITLISGFLGSGKTTLLNHLIKNTVCNTIGVIVNDFGKIVVDSQLVRAQNPGAFADGRSRIIEMPNGSIFCSCLESIFIDGLNYYRQHPPERLFIETSGMSDPSSMNKILGYTAALSDAFRVQNSLCVVDAEDFLDLLGIAQIVEKQIRFSNIVLLNKIDRVDSATSAEIKAAIVDLNPRTRIFETRFAAIDVTLLDATQASSPGQPLFAPPPVLLESFNTPQNRPATLLLAPKILDRSQLDAFLDSVRGHVLRIKGFYRIGKTTYYLDGNNKTITLTPFTDPVPEYGISIVCAPENKHWINAGWDAL